MTLHTICERCGQHVRQHEVANDEADLAKLMSEGRSQAKVGDAPWFGLFCPKDVTAD